MLILLTNDDGYDAPGLAALEQAARTCGDVVVVAPATEQSYMGHRVTTKALLTPVEYAPQRFHVNGTPADCVRIALRALGLQPDLVLSGINRGGNLGADIYTSGTVAAAREAAYLGLPALALSQYVNSQLELDWARAAHLAGRAIHTCRERGWNGGGRFWNVNLPHTEAAPSDVAILDSEPDCGPQDVRYRAVDGGFEYCGRYADRPATPGRDVALCLGGAITLSELRL
jgi:5'-nucleotidase